MWGEEGWRDEQSGVILLSVLHTLTRRRADVTKKARGSQRKRHFCPSSPEAPGTRSAASVPSWARLGQARRAVGGHTGAARSSSAARELPLQEGCGTAQQGHETCSGWGSSVRPRRGGARQTDQVIRSSGNPARRVATSGQGAPSERRRHSRHLPPPMPSAQLPPPSEAGRAGRRQKSEPKFFSQNR